MKLKKNTPQNKKSQKEILLQQVDEPVKESAEQEEFQSFFAEVLTKLPNKTAGIIRRSFEKSKHTAEKIQAKSRTQFDAVFSEFLMGVDDATKKKAHRIIHAASLTAAIIGCSPIPFSDAILLVPVQMTMMARLHKLFGQSWVEGIAKSISKELVVVSLGRSAVGNIIKFVPGVGTIAGASINAGVASAITESLGWVTVKMLNDGEDVFEQAMSFKGQYHTLFKALKKTRSKSS